MLTYVRDAYQLFDEYYARDSLRRRLAARAFLPAMRALGRVSSALAFPTAGLARAVTGTTEGAVLIPPGSPPPLAVARSPGASTLLFVGNGRLPAQGAGALIAAVGTARDRGASLSLTIVSRPGEEPLPPHPAWLRVINAEGAGIEALLPEVLATVIPRPRNPYNDLALPVKLFDYLAYGRPLLVTDCTEQAAIVAEADAGIVTEDGTDAMAAAMARMASAEAEDLDRWSRNATRAATAHSWRSRAALILETLGIES